MRPATTTQLGGTPSLARPAAYRPDAEDDRREHGEDDVAGATTGQHVGATARLQRHHEDAYGDQSPASPPAAERLLRR